MPGQPAHAAIVAEFGAEVLQPDGHLDRKRLGAIVFADPERRKRLEAITHPAIRRASSASSPCWRRRRFEGIVIWDVPLLFETGGAGAMDRVVVVVADEPTQLARLMARDGIAEAAARARMASQMPLGEKAAPRRLRHRQLGHPRRDGEAGARGPPGAPGGHGDAPAEGRAVSPRRNARARVVRERPAHGKRRALGQHFLRDPAVAQRIVDLVDPGPRRPRGRDRPGGRRAHRRLAARAGRLRALEVDAALIARSAPSSPVLATWRSSTRTRAATTTRASRALRPDPAGRVLVVGNLPYSAGKAILMALVEAGPGCPRRADEMALMLQREVAERVAAAPGSRVYGSLSVLTQMACDVRLAFSVPPGAFRPPPKVDSAVLHLRVRTRAAGAGGRSRPLRDVVRAAFASAGRAWPTRSPPASAWGWSGPAEGGRRGYRPHAPRRDPLPGRVRPACAAIPASGPVVLRR